MPHDDVHELSVVTANQLGEVSVSFDDVVNSLLHVFDRVLFWLLCFQFVQIFSEFLEILFPVWSFAELCYNFLPYPFIILFVLRGLFNFILVVFVQELTVVSL